MRKELPKRLEDGRVRTGYYRSDASDGAHGAFQIQGPCGAPLRIIASGADDNDTMSEDWEHVSVSIPGRNRPPNWTEMCFVKDLFWSEEECAVQFHPPKSEYVNNHAYCLHLWRHKSVQIPTPPSILVGLKDQGELTYEKAIKLLRERMGV